MQIKELKAKIETKELSDAFLILECPENYFVADQYIKAIAETREKEIKYNAEFSIIDNCISVLTVDELKEDIQIRNNLIVRCKAMKNKKYNDYVVTIPKLEDWQIKNYVGCQLPGLTNEQVIELCSKANYDIYYLQTEIDKLKLFTKEAQEFMYKDLVIKKDEKLSLFDLANALLKRDLSKIQKLIHNQFDGIALRTILLNNIKVIIAIQSNSAQNPSDLGVSEKQYYAIKKNTTGYYTTEKLTAIYKMLYNIDELVKTGKLKNTQVLDYILINML